MTQKEENWPQFRGKNELLPNKGLSGLWICLPTARWFHLSPVDASTRAPANLSFYENMLCEQILFI